MVWKNSHSEMAVMRLMNPVKAHLESAVGRSKGHPVAHLKTAVGRWMGGLTSCYERNGVDRPLS